MSISPYDPRKSFVRYWSFAVCAALLVMLSGNTPAVAQLFSKEQMKGLSGGIEAGALIGQTELDDKFAGQFRAFVRVRMSKVLQGELGVGSGRMSGKEFGTDMVLMDAKIVFNALEKGNWTPLYISTGFGVLRYDLDDIAPDRTVLAEPTGWSGLVPIEAGAQAVLMKNVGIEAKARYTYVFSDDINSFNSGSDNDSFRTFSVALVFGNLKR